MVTFPFLIAAVVSVSSSSLEVSFDTARRGAVTSVRTIDAAGVRGEEFAVPAAPCPLVSVECFRTEAVTERKTVHSGMAKGFEAGVRGETTALGWKDVGDCVETIRVKAVARADDVHIRWTVSVMPKPGWSLDVIDCPCIRLTKSLRGRPEDERLVFGRVKGGVIRNPGAEKREYWYHGQPGEWAAQFSVLYDDREGFYFGSEDTQAVKKHAAVYNRTAGLDFVHRRHFAREERYDSSYEVVTSGLVSDGPDALGWQDAADRYRAWAERQSWCRAKLRERTDLPDWIRQGAAFVRFVWNSERQGEAFARAWTENFRKEFPGVPLAAAIWGWEKNGMWVAPEYFPPRGGEERFRAFTAFLRERGAHPFAWPSGYAWTRTYSRQPDGSFRYDSRELYDRVARPHTCQHLNGERVIWKRWWLGEGENAYLCGLDEWVRNWFNNDVCLPLAKYGCDMIQVDQVVAGSAYACFDKTHGHGPGAYAEWGQGLRRQLTTLTDTLRRIEPQAFVGVEEPNESYLDLVGIQDYRDCEAEEAEWADVFNYLYHEYVPTFQSNLFRNDLWYAHCAVNGQMPGFTFAKEGDVGPDAQYEAFMRRWVGLYTGEGRDFLLYGRGIKPPRIICEKVPYEKKKWPTGMIQSEKPVVAGAAWRAPDGREALFFANGSREPRKFSYSWHGKTVELELAPFELRMIPVCTDIISVK